MTSRSRLAFIRNVVIALLLVSPAVGMAADFELFWDSNCNDDTDLQGYSIYYLEDDSVIVNLNDASEIIVPTSENGFDPGSPGYSISGLTDDVTYCFVVSANYRDGQSAMSNEICGVNGVYASSANSNPAGGSNIGLTHNSSGGCFIGLLKKN
jgi:hypothetical protein